MFYRKTLVCTTSIVAVAAALSVWSGQAQATPGLNTTLSANPKYTCTTNYYVDAASGDDSNPGTSALPWKSITNGDNGSSNTPTPGECVNVRPGTYSIIYPLGFTHGGTDSPSGSWSNSVIYRSTTPQEAHIIAGSTNLSSMVNPMSNFLVFDGFEIDGNKSPAATVGINACNGGNPSVSHILMENNVIHDVGSAGISACMGDYITIQNNVVYNTSSTDTYETSGIDIWEPVALNGASEATNPDGSQAFPIKILDNLVYNNMEGSSIPSPHTDGNGIIIDTTLGSGSSPTGGTPYAGNILLRGNLVFNNGGCGVNVFKSNNTVVAETTSYNNHLDQENQGTPRAELCSGGSTNVTWVNNTGYAVVGGGLSAYDIPAYDFAVGASGGTFPSNATWTNNIAYGAPPQAPGKFLLVNPDFVSIPNDNFSLSSGSPAIQTGVPETYLPSATPDIGAY